MTKQSVTIIRQEIYRIMKLHLPSNKINQIMIVYIKRKMCK